TVDQLHNESFGDLRLHLDECRGDLWTRSYDRRDDLTAVFSQGFHECRRILDQGFDALSDAKLEVFRHLLGFFLGRTCEIGEDWADDCTSSRKCRFSESAASCSKDRLPTGLALSDVLRERQTYGFSKVAFEEVQHLLKQGDLGG